MEIRSQPLSDHEQRITEIRKQLPGISLELKQKKGLEADSRMRKIGHLEQILSTRERKRTSEAMHLDRNEDWDAESMTTRSLKYGTTYSDGSAGTGLSISEFFIP